MIVVGLAWSKEDLEKLQNSLIDVAREISVQRAIETLDVAYQITALTEAKYDTLYNSIVKQALHEQEKE
jgi:hypothetical protein